MRVLEFFDLNLVQEMINTLQQNALKNFDFNIRNPLIIFLIQTKFVIRLIKNSEIIRKDDLFVLDNYKKLQDLKSHNQYQEVKIGSKDQNKLNYDKMGNKMYKLFSKLVRAHTPEVNYSECLLKINDPNYLDNALDKNQISNLVEKIKKNKTPNLLNLNGIKSYLLPDKTNKRKEITQLQLCFPDAEFLILYYRLIDSFFTQKALTLYSGYVKYRQTLYIPEQLFEGEFMKNERYPQTRVRNIKNKNFLDSLTPEFLIQDYFFGSKYKGCLNKPEYVHEFLLALDRYDKFSFESIYGRNIFIF